MQYSIDELGGSSMNRLGGNPWQNGHLFARSVRFANQFSAIAPNVVVGWPLTMLIASLFYSNCLRTL